MKKILTTFFVLSFLLLISCEDKKKDCSEYELDFTYSLGYPVDSSYAIVEYAETGNNLPTDAYYEWEVVGDSQTDYLYYKAVFIENGNFAINMTFYAEGFTCSVTKEFEISGIK